MSQVHLDSSDERPDDHIIVVFGATGDLARRKIIPGLYHLASAGLLPHRGSEVIRVLGDATSDESSLSCSLSCGLVRFPGRCRWPSPSGGGS